MTGALIVGAMTGVWIVLVVLFIVLLFAYIRVRSRRLGR
jgi:hypothetical protein